MGTLRSGRLVGFCFAVAALQARSAAPPGFPRFALGVEYTERGLAAVYGLTGVTWAKTRLEAFSWGAVEKSPPQGGRHTYDWSCTDALISEYQGAGLLDVQSYLSPASTWGSVSAQDVMPKAHVLPDFEAWVGALVERYDGDGRDDMPGLRAPVRLWVAGPEWTGFWPSGNADDYLVFLSSVRKAAKAADPLARIGLIPFLLYDVFAGNVPTAAEVAERLKDPPPGHRKSTAGMLKMLDRPDLFDYVDVHSLGDYTELPPTLAWFRDRMAERGYDRPVFVDDAFPLSALASWHPLPGIGLPALYPVTEDRYQRVYRLLQDVAKLDEPAYGTAMRWIRAEVAMGLVKKAVTAAGEGYWGIQLGNTEDWMEDANVASRQLTVNFIGAAAMMGLVDVTHPPGGTAVCGARIAGSPRAGWHTVGLAARTLSGTTGAERIAGLPPGVWAYRILEGNEATTVVWYEARELPLPLPGEAEQTLAVDLPVADAAEVTVTTTPTDVSSTKPSTLALPVSSGKVRVTVGRAPLLVAPSPGKAIATLSLPVVLSAAGAASSFYTSELALTNAGTTDATLRLDYRAAWGTGSGTATETLPAGRQKVVPDAVAWLRSLGVPLPSSGSLGGPLTVTFEGLSRGGAAAVNVRTTTALPEGRAGLSYAGLPSWQLPNGPVILWGLRQDALDRTNVAVRHAGTTADGSVTLRLSILLGPAAGVTPFPIDVTLAPGELRQLSGLLEPLGLASAAVRVERLSGAAPFDAYAVVNDQVTSDGSFVPPWPASLSTSRLTVPAVVETSAYTTEVVVGNGSARARRLRLSYVADALSAPSADLLLELAAGEQRLLPAFVAELRRRGVAGVGPAGPTFAGALFVTAEDGNPLDGVFAGARTTTPGAGGRFGLFAPAVPEEGTVRREAWLHGLLQDDETRTNAALVNLGESESVFRLEVFDGETGRLAGARDGVRLGPRRWTQIPAVLTAVAPGTRNGYVRVTQTSGRNPFLAYAVLNDGASPGERTGDGAYVAMAVAE